VPVILAPSQLAAPPTLPAGARRPDADRADAILPAPAAPVAPGG
jgi:hypothetical protein